MRPREREVVPLESGCCHKCTTDFKLFFDSIWNNVFRKLFSASLASSADRVIKCEMLENFFCGPRVYAGTAFLQQGWQAAFVEWPIFTSYVSGIATLAALCPLCNTVRQGGQIWLPLLQVRIITTPWLCTNINDVDEWHVTMQPWPPQNRASPMVNPTHFNDVIYLITLQDVLFSITDKLLKSWESWVICFCYISF